jgi:ribosomal protein S21
MSSKNMPIRVSRKEQENTFSLIKRFSTKVNQYKILKEAKEKMFKEREKSRDRKKIEALRRLELKKQYERLKKLGKI